MMLAALVILASALGTVRMMRSQTTDELREATVDRVVHMVEEFGALNGESKATIAFGVDLPKEIGGEPYYLAFTQSFISLSQGGHTFIRPVIIGLHLWNPGSADALPQASVEDADQFFREIRLSSTDEPFVLERKATGAPGSCLSFLYPEATLPHQKEVESFLAKVKPVFDLHDTGPDELNQTLKLTTSRSRTLTQHLIVTGSDPSVCAPMPEVHLWEPDGYAETDREQTGTKDNANPQLHLKPGQTLTVERLWISIEEEDGNHTQSMGWFVYV